MDSSMGPSPWERFAHDLQIVLGVLNEDEFLILSKSASCYIQFAALGSVGMRVEAVSNFYLPDDERLDEPRHRALMELGWHAPTKFPDELQFRHDPVGSPNYFVDAAAPVPYEVLAQIAVDTLLGVYGASHPDDLEYLSFSTDGASIRFPNLGIPREEEG